MFYLPIKRKARLHIKYEIPVWLGYINEQKEKNLIILENQ